MSPTLEDGQILIVNKMADIESGDIIAFYHGNKILVKRVIATPGEWVNIDEYGQVYINGIKLKEPYIEKLIEGEIDIELPYQVPDGHWFVLGDQRKSSIDSRNAEIGSISKEDLVGKILVRVWPLKKLGNLK